MIGPSDRQRLLSRFGPEVNTWCDTLPALIARLTERWALRVVRPMPGGTSYTLLCRRRDTTPVVLKLTPEAHIAVEEHAALRARASCGRMMSVLDADLEVRALLLEGLQPGTAARDQPLPVIAKLLAELHIPATGGFIPLHKRIDFMFSLLRRRRPAANGEIDRAERAALELADDPVPARLLHGDLHQANILYAGPRGLVAIDPRPCVGDPAFDAIDFAFEGGPSDVKRRISALSTAVDGDRLRLWCDALSVFFPGVAARQPDG